MNTQTEQLDNHTARLTVEVEPERLENAKRTAAQKLAKRLNIPGFRKGKAPYQIVINYVGEAAVVEDALEVLGNEIYKQVLDESQIEPYGPGQLEDVKVEGNPVFTFVVPLQPAVDLKDYRSIRVEFEPELIEDEAVTNAIKTMQEQHAVVEESYQPVALGNRITADIDGRLVDEAEGEAETEEAEHEEAHEEGDEHHHLVDEKTILHQHDAVLSLSEEAEPAPGFAAAVVGAAVGERRQFELTYPEDEEEYKDLSGKRAKFDVTIKKIENVTLPALNDEFAARVTQSEEKPLSLLELRIRVRENLQSMADDRKRSDYSREILDQMVEQSDVRYPEAMVVDQIQRFLQQFDQELRQRGITLDDYMKIYKKKMEDLYEDYREVAVRTVERSLVLQEVMRRENVGITDEQVSEEIDKIASQFGERAADYRALFSDAGMRQTVMNDLLNQKILDRIVAIGKGEAPEVIGEAPSDGEASEEEGESA